jgi:hypothetical protein
VSAEGDSSFWTAAIGVGVIVAVRLVDWLLPSGHHFRAVDHWAEADDDDMHPDDEHDY